MIDVAVLEGLAKRLHDETGLEPPISGFDLLDVLDISIRYTAGEKAKVNVRTRMCSIGTRMRLVRQNGRAAHEASHQLLFDNGLDHTDEAAANYLSGALLLPWTRFRRDLERTNWDLPALCELYPHASAQMITTRMVQASPVTAAIWDQGKLHVDLGRGDADRELVDEVLATERPARAGAVRAWPFISRKTATEPEYRRVIVVGRQAA